MSECARTLVNKVITPISVQTQRLVLQRKCICNQDIDTNGECETYRRKDERTIRRAVVNAIPANIVPPIVHDALDSPGQPLDTGTRAFMEQRFGHDFSQVRVHTDARAAKSARAVNSLAYTVGRDVVFGDGHYEPRTYEGRKLLAHELTHVIQQNTSVSMQNLPDKLEREATIATNSIMESQPFNITPQNIGKIATLRLNDSASEIDHGQVPSDIQERLNPEIFDAGTDQSGLTGTQGSPKGKGTTSQLSSCQPEALSREDFLKRPGAKRQDSDIQLQPLGLTRLVASDATIPELKVESVSGGVKVLPTVAALPPITSIYTGSGTFIEGDSMYVGNCPGGKKPIKWVIYPDGAKKIAECEKEHCDDFVYAFNISLRRYADAVNQFSKSKRIFRNKSQVERELTRQVGMAPEKWREVFYCLTHRSVEVRDNLWRSHTPKPHVIKPDLHRKIGCDYMQFWVLASSFPNIGKDPAYTVIKDCERV